MMNRASLLPFPLCMLLFYFLVSVCICVNVTALNDENVAGVVKKEERKSVVSSEFGTVSAVNVSDGGRRSYHLQFITMDPNALFLPLLLHADMVFYVHSGSGRLTWSNEDGDVDEILVLNVSRGDVFRLKQGTVFFLETNLEPQGQKLQIHSIFPGSNDDLREPETGPYSSIRDLLLGFDKKVLQAAFKVPEEIIDAITNGTSQSQPLIVHGVPKSLTTFWDFNVQIMMKALMGSRGYSMFDVNNSNDKVKLYNILTGKKDVENCNGWSSTVTRKKLDALKDTNIGIFMVNLTKGSMMAPHWNPMGAEIAIVLQGQGMVRVVCSSTVDGPECKNRRFRVKEGDVFAVPRFHPMAQISFNDDTFVFMGFTTTSKRNHPQFLAGKNSILQTLEYHVLAASFNVPNATIDQLLAPQKESVILECTSCAEEEEKIMEEEIKKEEEEAKKKGEEAQKKEQEEAKEKGGEEAQKKEQEEAKEKGQEETKKKEQEKAKEKEQEEAQKKGQEEAKEKEQEEAKEKGKEEAQKKGQEEAKEKEQEEAEEKEQEEAKEKEQKEAQKKEQEEAKEKGKEEAQKKGQEEAKEKGQEEAQKKGQEEAKEKEQKEAQKKEQEEAQKKEQEEAKEKGQEEAKEKGQEEAQKKGQEEAKEKEQEEAQKKEQEEAKEKEQKEAQKKEQEEAQKKIRELEEALKREREEALKREREECRKRQEKARKIEQEEAQKEQQEAGKKEEQQVQREEEKRMEEAAAKEEEAARRHEEEKGKKQEKGRKEGGKHQEKEGSKKEKGLQKGKTEEKQREQGRTEGETKETKGGRVFTKLWKA